MTKTIEEAANKAIIDNEFFMADPNHPEFVDRGLEQMRACKWVINHIFSLPLSQRLTDEGRERARDIYNEAVEICKNADPMGSRFAFWDARKELIESIFGKELFGEE